MKVISKNEKDKLINVYLNIYSGEVTAIRLIFDAMENLGCVSRPILMWGFHIHGLAREGQHRQPLFYFCLFS